MWNTEFSSLHNDLVWIKNYCERYSNSKVTRFAIPQKLYSKYYNELNQLKTLYYTVFGEISFTSDKMIGEEKIIAVFENSSQTKFVRMI